MSWSIKNRLYTQFNDDREKATEHSMSPNYITPNKYSLYQLLGLKNNYWYSYNNAIYVNIHA